MKKGIFFLVAGYIITLSTNAQNSQIRAGFLPFNKALSAADPGNKTDIRINAKALRDFEKKYKTITNAEWYPVKDGFMAKFAWNGIDHKVAYNKAGYYVATFRYYNEDKLPNNVRHLVKSTWYDGDITLVTEVSFSGSTAYLVNIEDKNSIKTIKVVKDEMEVYQDITKTGD